MDSSDCASMWWIRVFSIIQSGAVLLCTWRETRTDIAYSTATFEMGYLSSCWCTTNLLSSRRLAFDFPLQRNSRAIRFIMLYWNSVVMSSRMLATRTEPEPAAGPLRQRDCPRGLSSHVYTSFAHCQYSSLLYFLVASHPTHWYVSSPGHSGGLKDQPFFSISTEVGSWRQLTEAIFTQRLTIEHTKLERDN